MSKVVDAFESQVNDDQTAVQEARKSMDALKDLPAATAYCAEAKKAYRYFGQERVRSVVSFAFQEMLPFPWELNWSLTTIQRRLLQLQGLLEPITIRRKSRLLRSFPVPLIATILDFIWNRGCNESTWWTSPDNMGKVAKSCLAAMRDSAGNNVAEQQIQCVVQCVELLGNFVLFLTYSFGEFKLDEFSGKDLEFERLICTRVKEVQSGNEDPWYCFLSQEQVSYLLKLLSAVNPCFAAEVSKSVITQRAILLRDAKVTFTSFCKAGDSEHGPRFCVDEVLLDGVHILSDLWNLVSGMKAEANESILQDFMRVLYVPWDEDWKPLHFKKLFLLALGFYEGVDPKSIDISDLTESLLLRLSDDGTYRSKFTKGMKNRSIKAGYHQRDPRHQPVVILNSQWGGSDDDEEPSQKHIVKRTAVKRTAERGPDSSAKRTRLQNSANISTKEANGVSIPLSISNEMFSREGDSESNAVEASNETPSSGARGEAGGKSSTTRQVRFAGRQEEENENGAEHDNGVSRSARTASFSGENGGVPRQSRECAGKRNIRATTSPTTSGVPNST